MNARRQPERDPRGEHLVGLLVCCLAVIIGCFTAPGQATAAAAPAATSTPSPIASPTSGASPLITPTLTASPSPTPSPTYNFVFRPMPDASPDPAAPQILEIDLNDRELSAGGPLLVRVLTSINTNGVYVHVAGKTLGVPPIVPGRFERSGLMPKLPFFYKGRTYHVDFEAVTVDGKQTHVDVPIFVRH